MIVGFINYYDRKPGISIIIEGTIITPARVSSLVLKHLKVRAAFLGFTETAHIEKIVQSAYNNQDWIYKKIMFEDNNDETAVRNYLQNEIHKNVNLAEEAKERGYAFFDTYADSFENSCAKVVTYLLDDSK